MKSTIFAALSAALSFAATTLEAAPIMFNFTAERTSISGALGPGRLVTDLIPFTTISGSFGYDFKTTVVPNAPGVTEVRSAFFDVDQGRLAGPIEETRGRTRVTNDQFIDGFFMQAATLGGLDTLEIVLSDLQMTAFSGPDFADSFADLSQFEVKRLTVTSGGVGFGIARYTITSITPVNAMPAVPLPASLPLLTVAGLGLWRLGQRKARR